MCRTADEFTVSTNFAASALAEVAIDRTHEYLTDFVVVWHEVYIVAHS